MKKIKIEKIVLVSFSLLLLALSIAGCSTNTNSNIIAAQDNANANNLSAKSGGQAMTVISSANPSNIVSIVTIKDFAFTPQTVTIKAGSNVKWINQDSVTHTIKSDAINSPKIGSGESFEFTFNTPGSYDYICGIHASMKGKVIVT